MAAFLKMAPHGSLSQGDAPWRPVSGWRPMAARLRMAPHGSPSQDGAPMAARLRMALHGSPSQDSTHGSPSQDDTHGSPSQDGAPWQSFSGWRPHGSPPQDGTLMASLLPLQDHFCSATPRRHGGPIKPRCLSSTSRGTNKRNWRVHRQPCADRSSR